MYESRTEYKMIVGTDSVPTPTGVFSATTWNPSDKNAAIDLSGNNLIATAGASASGGHSLRSTTGVTNGKWYWEIVLVAEISGGGSIFAGIEISSGVLNDYIGLFVNTSSVGNQNSVWLNGGTIGNIGSWAAGGNVSIAYDKPNAKLWMRLNGGTWNDTPGDDPATNTGGYDISALAAGTYMAAATVSTTGDSLLAKFSPANWTYAAPSGFVHFP